MSTGNPEIDNSTHDYIVGSDECGYGAWAGPLVVCAAVVSKDWPFNNEVKDSKAFKNEASRNNVARKILKAVTCCLVSVSPEDVDKKGVYKAVIEAHGEAITKVIAKHDGLGCVGTYLVVVDGNLKISYEHKGKRLVGISLPKADALVPAVSAASIIGKVARDAHMKELAKKYPGYGFENHKGYGVPEHQEALAKLGICDQHRKSYGPIAALAKKDDEPRELWGTFGDDD